MEALDLITAILGVPIVAGALGGFVRWLHLGESPRQAARSILIGALVGNFFWSIGGKWLEGVAEGVQIDPANARGAGAFFVGMIAIWVIQSLFDYGRRKTEIRKES